MHQRGRKGDDDILIVADVRRSRTRLPGVPSDLEALETSEPWPTLTASGVSS
jgi:hypothetical protein